MEEALRRLKQEWNANPILVLTVLGGFMGGAGKLIGSITGAASKAKDQRLWAAEVRRREAKQAQRTYHVK